MTAARTTRELSLALFHAPARAVPGHDASAPGHGDDGCGCAKIVAGRRLSGVAHPTVSINEESVPITSGLQRYGDGPESVVAPGQRHRAAVPVVEVSGE